MRGKISLLRIAFALLLHVVDVGSDIFVATTYYQQDDLWWFGITIALVILPSILVNFCSWIFFAKSPKWKPQLRKLKYRFLACVFQLSVIQLYWDEFKQWKRENCRDTVRCINENINDDVNCSCERRKSILKERRKVQNPEHVTRYIEAFSESAPQWCLQNYIMLRQWSFPWITITSTVFSILSSAWSITAVEIRKQLKDNQTKTFPKSSLIVFLVFQLGIFLLSRLSAIVIFAYAFRQYVFIILGIHVAVVTVVLMINDYRQGDFHCCGSSTLSFIIAFISLFHYFVYKFNDKMVKIVEVIFYFVVFLENVIMVLFSVWYQPTNTLHIYILAKIVLPLVFVGFGIGILFCLLYNIIFYPSWKLQRLTVELTNRSQLKHG